MKALPRLPSPFYILYIRTLQEQVKLLASFFFNYSFYFLLMLFPIFNFKINETDLRSPCFPVQAPVLYGFRQMACFDIRRGFQVGDRTGDFQDTVVGAGGKI